MSTQCRYAILDTDFILKANIIRTADRTLADEVLSFPGYRFFCHQKMKEELEDHGTVGAREWLEGKIENGEISLYDDARIIQELRNAVGDNCYKYFQSFLKRGCDMFSADYYAEYFQLLDDWIAREQGDDGEFQSVLASCEGHIGHGKNYGEIKAAVLLKALRFLDDVEISIFCSDDFGARQGFANVERIPCISILAVFWKLMAMGKTIEEVQPLYQSFVDWCTQRVEPQVNVKVWEFSRGTYRKVPVPIEGLLDDIFAEKYETRMNGDLQVSNERSN